MSSHRSGRINEEMKKEISMIIQNSIKDPRLHTMVSVTRVDVTKDLRYAKVFVSIFGDDKTKEDALTALKSSAGFIRREAAHNINLRYAPEIIIKEDDSIEHGMHIDKILDKIKEKENNED